MKNNLKRYNQGRFCGGRCQIHGYCVNCELGEDKGWGCIACFGSKRKDNERKQAQCWITRVREWRECK